jgi:hypothetical protein
MGLWTVFQSFSEKANGKQINCPPKRLENMPRNIILSVRVILRLHKTFMSKVTGREYLL